MTAAASVLDPSLIFGLGMIGGALPDVYYLYKKRRGAIPKHVTKKFYWFMFFVMALLGGGTALLYNSSTTINAFMAIHLGLSTPILLQLKLAEGSDKISVD